MNNENRTEHASPRHTGGRNRGMIPGEKAKDFKKTTLRLAKFVGRYKISLILVLIFAAGATLFNILSPKILGIATTELFNGLMDKISGQGHVNFHRLGQILVFLLLLYGLASLLSFAQGWIMSGISQKTAYTMRKLISEKINRIPVKYFESRTVGDVLSRITNDVDTVGQNLNQCISQLIMSLTMVIGVFFMMLSISVVMTLVALFILPVSMFLVKEVMKHSQKYFRAQQQYLGKINGQVEENYAGHSIIMAFNREEDAIREFDKTNEILYHSAWKSQFLSGMMQPIMGFVGNLGYVGVTVTGSILAVKGAITVGDIQAFIQYIKNFTQPVKQLAQITNLFQAMAAAAERVFEFLDEEEEENEPDHPVSMEEIRGSVDFSHVKFGYDPENIIIHDFSQHIEPGQMIAIVGPTGAGKTTMVKLLMRFYEVNGGTISVDGHNIKEFNRNELREAFGMVLQDTWLFQGTIMENIRYGKLDATDEEVYAAAKAAHAHHFIKTLPGGYEMELNEDASNISQGQKQLLTIARAILADNRILILDEATSSVDTRTEHLIQDAMAALMKGRTSFVIAHRLSTIKDADLILVMKEGDIIEKGTHEELLARQGFYYDLYNAQFEKTE